MKTLAQQLGETAPVSMLVRKARRLGLPDLDAAICLAVHRGCKHYVSPKSSFNGDPGVDQLGDDELTILLLSGSQSYNPVAIRCAAQLARSPRVDPDRLAKLAIREKSIRTLAHIARAGKRYDLGNESYWSRILKNLPKTKKRLEPDLPHWSRFVSMPGIQRGGVVPHRWLVPTP